MTISGFCGCKNKAKKTYFGSVLKNIFPAVEWQESKSELKRLKP